MSDDPYVGGENEQEDEREELEAMIEQADLAFASESFGTTALEQEEGESLDDRLKEEVPPGEPVESGLAIEDEAARDEEEQMVGEASFEHEPSLAPEEAALTIRERAPGAVDHPEEAAEPVDDHPWDED